MYIVINKITQESAIFKEKTQLCEYIGASTRTILRNEHKKMYEKGNYMVYFPNIIEIKSSRGGFRSGSSGIY